MWMLPRKSCEHATAAGALQSAGNHRPRLSRHAAVAQHAAPVGNAEDGRSAPQVIDAAIPPDQACARPAQIDAAAPPDQACARPAQKVLVVDDEDDFRSIFAMLLEELGIQIITASNGSEALELAEREQPDLIFLDQRMPGLRGSEVAQELRTRHVQAPIIMVTAAHDIGEIAQAAGTSLWLQKPFGLDELEDVIRRAKQGR